MNEYRITIRVISSEEEGFVRRRAVDLALSLGHTYGTTVEVVGTDVTEDIDLDIHDSEALADKLYPNGDPEAKDFE